MSEELIAAITTMSKDDALRITHELLESEVDPEEILNVGRVALQTIGERFEAGEFFLPELIVSGDISTTGTAVGMGVAPVIVAVPSISGSGTRAKAVAVDVGGSSVGTGVSVGGAVCVGVGIGILVAVPVGVGLSVRVAVGSSVDVAVGSSVGDGGTGVGSGIDGAVGAVVGSGTVGTNVGNTKIDIGSPWVTNAPPTTPKATSITDKSIAHLPRIMLVSPPSLSF